MSLADFKIEINFKVSWHNLGQKEYRINIKKLHKSIINQRWWTIYANSELFEVLSAIQKSRPECQKLIDSYISNKLPNYSNLTTDLFCILLLIRQNKNHKLFSYFKNLLSIFEEDLALLLTTKNDSFVSEIAKEYLANLLLEKHAN